jgi:hypothetical protein
MDDGLQGLAPVEPRKPAGIMPNAQYQAFHGFMTGAPYELAIVEFDDQGRSYDRGQMDAVAKRLDALAAENSSQGQDVILVAFVHGWKHDARPDDDNLTSFRALLNRTVDHERWATAAGAKPRPVLGVFVGWRGPSDFGLGDVVADATFWGRQAAGQRVAVGSVRELFGRLRHYRNRRRKDGGNPLLVIVGHSFGGMIVYSALAQSLIQAASAPVGRVTPEFADLVLLVNPAIEGARYIPIYDLVTSGAFAARTTKQLPVFICAQANNDQPVGLVFPLGNAGHAMDEATIGDLEKECVTHALGFVPSFRPIHCRAPMGGALRAGAARKRASQSVLGGGSGEGSHRRTWRHLADAVSSLHRQPSVSTCAGFEAGAERRRDDRSARRERRTVGRFAMFAKTIQRSKLRQP